MSRRATTQPSPCSAYHRNIIRYVSFVTISWRALMNDCWLPKNRYSAAACGDARSCDVIKPPSQQQSLAQRHADALPLFGILLLLASWMPSIGRHNRIVTRCMATGWQASHVETLKRRAENSLMGMVSCSRITSSQRFIGDKVLRQTTARHAASSRHAESIVMPGVVKLSSRMARVLWCSKQNATGRCAACSENDGGVRWSASLLRPQIITTDVTSTDEAGAAAAVSRNLRQIVAGCRRRLAHWIGVSAYKSADHRRVSLALTRMHHSRTASGRRMAAHSGGQPKLSGADGDSPDGTQQLLTIQCARSSVSDEPSSRLRLVREPIPPQTRAPCLSGY